MGELPLRIAFCLLTATLIAAGCGGGRVSADGDAPPSGPPSGGDPVETVMIDRIIHDARAGVPIDFATLRREYVLEDDYIAHDYAVRARVDELLGELESRPHGAVLEDLLALLEPRYCDLWLWGVTVNVAHLAGDDRAAPLLAALEDLLAAVTADGRNARSQEAAIPVVSIWEEYYIVHALGLAVEQQSLVGREDGRSYDRLRTVWVDDGAPGPDLWFEVTALFASYVDGAHPE